MSKGDCRPISTYVSLPGNSTMRIITPLMCQRSSSGMIQEACSAIFSMLPSEGGWPRFAVCQLMAAMP